MTSEKSGLSLLVVDDEPMLRTLLVRGLQSQGYAVSEAENGEQALAFSRDHNFHLVLMDVSMPVMDGFTACQHLHAIRPQLPIIMLTGHDDIESVNAAFNAGATDFISKPINLPLLNQRVRYALRATFQANELNRAYHDQNTACRLARLGFWRINMHTGDLQFSADAHELLGLDCLPEKRSDLADLLTTEQLHKLTMMLQAAVSSGSTLDTEVQLGKGKTIRHLRLMADNALDPLVISGAFQDITEQRSKDQQIAYLAEHDNLTGLAKRRLFISQLEQILSTCETEDVWVVVALDIARMQRINDALGSEAGDQLLIMVAQKLADTLPKEHLLARLEADCFIFASLLPVDIARTQNWLAAQLKPLEETWQLQRQMVSLNFKGGFALSEPGIRADALLQQAVRAKAQVTPGGRLSLMSDQGLVGQDGAGLLALEEDLRLAFDRNEFFLLYQPQESLADGCISSVEALARWQHPDRGLLGPDRFIPLLESMGLMTEFGDWVLRTASRQALAWASEGLHMVVAINLSATQFNDHDLVSRMLTLCAEENCSPTLLEVEITESMAMTNPTLALSHLQALKQEGFRIAIDDFGVGYSSMEYLLQFPHDVLKIDRTFVTGITDSKGSRAIIRAITSFCESTGIACLAEGVETERQRDYLDALGVDFIQGYLLARPLLPADLVNLLASRRSL